MDASTSTSDRLRDVREKVSLVDRVNVEGRPAYDGGICDRLGSMVTMAHSDWQGKLRVVGITMGWRPIDMHFDPRGLREHVLLLEGVGAWKPSKRCMKLMVERLWLRSPHRVAQIARIDG